MKLASNSYDELKEFSMAIEEELFLLSAPREKAQTPYKTDEVQMTAVDEFYVEQDKMGRVLRQIARVRVFFLAFLSGNTILTGGIFIPRDYNVVKLRNARCGTGSQRSTSTG